MAITTGSSRSLRSLGRAKARPLTKRYAMEEEKCSTSRKFKK
jgi:hypothetical protein